MANTSHCAMNSSRQQDAPNSDAENHSKDDLPSISPSSSSSSSSSCSSASSSSSLNSSSSSSNITAFLSKLWRLVNDHNNNDLIRWSHRGCSFVITNQIQFAKDLLPLYFKHSNMASFIRQLNMYGFKKIPIVGGNNNSAGSLGNSSVNIGNAASADQRADLAQFYHVNFMRGQEQRLACIKRTVTLGIAQNNSCKTHNLIVNGSFCDEVRAILSDVKSIRDGQNSSESILGSIQVGNKSLWRDVAILKSQHHKQRRVIEKLIQFLLSLIQNRPNNMVTKKRKVRLMMRSVATPTTDLLANPSSSATDNQQEYHQHAGGHVDLTDIEMMSVSSACATGSNGGCSPSGMVDSPVSDTASMIYRAASESVVAAAAACSPSNNSLASSGIANSAQFVHTLCQTAMNQLSLPNSLDLGEVILSGSGGGTAHSLDGPKLSGLLGVDVTDELLENQYLSDCMLSGGHSFHGTASSVSGQEGVMGALLNENCLKGEGPGSSAAQLASLASPLANMNSSSNNGNNNNSENINTGGGASNGYHHHHNHHHHLQQVDFGSAANSDLNGNSNNTTTNSNGRIICQNVTQWTANSIYNTMTDGVSATTNSLTNNLTGSISNSNNNTNNNSANSGGGHNPSNVFNELRASSYLNALENGTVLHSDLSALQQQQHQQHNNHINSNQHNHNSHHSQHHHQHYQHHQHHQHHQQQHQQYQHLHHHHGGCFYS